MAAELNCVCRLADLHKIAERATRDRLSNHSRAKDGGLTAGRAGPPPPRKAASPHRTALRMVTVGARGECDGPRCALDAWTPDQSRGAQVRAPERSPPQAAWLRRWTSASAGRASGWPGKHATRSRPLRQDRAAAD